MKLLHPVARVIQKRQLMQERRAEARRLLQRSRLASSCGGEGLAHLAERVVVRVCGFDSVIREPPAQPVERSVACVERRE